MSGVVVKKTGGLMRGFADGKVVATASRQSGETADWHGWVVSFPVDSAGEAEAELLARAQLCHDHATPVRGDVVPAEELDREPFDVDYFLEDLGEKPDLPHAIRLVP